MFGQIFVFSLYMYVHMEYNESKKNGQHPERVHRKKEEIF